MASYELPDNFDVIVYGTGMPESILAAAAARVGKSVLHLDRNEHYGNLWASFSFEALIDWLSGLSTSPRTEWDQHLIQEGETALPLNPRSPFIQNIDIFSFSPSSLDEPEPGPFSLESDSDSCSQKPLVEQKESAQEDLASPSQEGTDPELPEKADLPQPDEPECSTSESDCQRQNEGGECEASSSSQHTSYPNFPEKIPKENPLEDIKKNNKKFNLDISPKVLFSRGSLVKLLISSNTTRYAEFKAFTRILTFYQNILEIVPVTRSDVFAAKNISIIEKRMLMKFLTACLEEKDDPEAYEDFKEVPIYRFLESKKITPNIQHYIVNSIGMCEMNTPTPQAIKSIVKFLTSLGYYGNSPFLWPIYGSGELPQGFCRLCAVFGGTFCLKRSVDALILSEDGSISAIISEGQRINCKWFVLDSCYAPDSLLNVDATALPKLSKAIFITNKSIQDSEKEEITLLRVPQSEDVPSSVTVIEAGPGTMVCPRGYFIVYMTALSACETAKEDLEPVAKKLFTFEDAGKGESVKPVVFWALYYNQIDTSCQDLSVHLRTKGLIVTPTPDSNPDYDKIVDRAKALFHHMYPDEDFLPRAPDPDEIIFDAEEAGNPTSSSNDPNPMKADVQPNEECAQGEPMASTDDSLKESPPSEDTAPSSLGEQ